jgi:hypothetical protein
MFLIESGLISQFTMKILITKGKQMSKDQLSKATFTERSPRFNIATITKVLTEYQTKPVCRKDGTGSLYTLK